MTKSYRNLIAQSVLAASMVPGTAAEVKPVFIPNGSPETQRYVMPQMEQYCKAADYIDQQHADHLIVACEHKAVPFNRLVNYLEEAKNAHGSYPKDVILRFADDPGDTMRSVIDTDKLLALSKAMENSSTIRSESLALGYCQTPDAVILHSVKGVVLPTSSMKRPTEEIVKELKASFERIYKAVPTVGKSLI